MTEIKIEIYLHPKEYHYWCVLCQQGQHRQCLWYTHLKLSQRMAWQDPDLKWRLYYENASLSFKWLASHSCNFAMTKLVDSSSELSAQVGSQAVTCKYYALVCNKIVIIIVKIPMMCSWSGLWPRPSKRILAPRCSPEYRPTLTAFRAAWM